MSLIDLYFFVAIVLIGLMCVTIKKPRIPLIIVAACLWPLAIVFVVLAMLAEFAVWVTENI